MSAIDDLPPLRDVIRRHGLAAKKSLGQNFLSDLNLTARIARAAGPLAGVDVIEIGPTVIPGDEITSAAAEQPQNSVEWVVSIDFNGKGGDTWADITGKAACNPDGDPKRRIAIVLDNFSPHLSTNKDQRVGDWAAANNVELAYTPFYGSWLNRIEAQFTALRYFALDGTDHPTHAEQARMIRRYIAWRNRNAHDRDLREVINRANVA